MMSHLGFDKLHIRIWQWWSWTSWWDTLWVGQVAHLTSDIDEVGQDDATARLCRVRVLVCYYINPNFIHHVIYQPEQWRSWLRFCDTLIFSKPKVNLLWHNVTYVRKSWSTTREDTQISNVIVIYIDEMMNQKWWRTTFAAPQSHLTILSRRNKGAHDESCTRSERQTILQGYKRSCFVAKV